MTCDCRARIEAKLTERFKENEPDARDHKVDLQGYAFGVGPDNSLFMRPYMPWKAGAEYPLKKGGTKWKNKTGNMFFNFCPFCGDKLDKSATDGVVVDHHQGPEPSDADASKDRP